MKISMVTPSYPSTDCGIATYTGYLTNSLSESAQLEIIGGAQFADAKDFTTAVLSHIGDADVVHLQHTYDLYGYMGYNSFKLLRALKQTGKKVVTTIHELPNPKTTGLKAAIALPYLKQVIKSILANSSAVIVHSKADFNLIKSWGMNTSNLHVIAHGTIEHTNDLQARDADSLTGNIGFFGFVMPHKGIHRVINIMHEFPDHRLIIAGKPKSEADQQYFESLETSVQTLDLGNQVEFAGFIPDDEMADFFSRMDAVVFPYSSCTASGALHLALAHESVTLASDIDIFREMHDQYDCVELFDLDDASSLSVHLRRILTDHQRRQELIKGARQMSQSTGWGPVAEEHIRLYQSLIG